MNHIQAFYAFPIQKQRSPTELYSASIICLLPTSYLCKVDEVTLNFNGKTVSKICPFSPPESVLKKVITTIIMSILFLPSIILGTILRGVAYSQQDVRALHNKIIHYKTAGQSTALQSQ